MWQEVETFLQNNIEWSILYHFVQQWFNCFEKNTDEKYNN